MATYAVGCSHVSLSRQLRPTTAIVCNPGPGAMGGEDSVLPNETGQLGDERILGPREEGLSLLGSTVAVCKSAVSLRAL